MSELLRWSWALGLGAAAMLAGIQHAEAKPPSMTQRVTSPPCIGVLFESEQVMYRNVEAMSSTMLQMWERIFYISQGRGTWENSHDPNACTWEIKVGKQQPAERQLARYLWLRCQVEGRDPDPSRVQLEVQVLTRDHGVVRIWTGEVSAACHLTYEGPDYE